MQPPPNDLTGHKKFLFLFLKGFQRGSFLPFNSLRINNSIWWWWWWWLPFIELLLFVRHCAFLISKGELWIIPSKFVLPAAFPISGNTNSISSCAQVGLGPYHHQAVTFLLGSIISPRLLQVISLLSLLKVNTAARVIDPVKMEVLSYHCCTQSSRGFLFHSE